MFCTDAVYEQVLGIRKVNRQRLEEKLLDVQGEEAYIPTRAGETRVLIYAPEADGPVPVYFDVHGGGFIGIEAFERIINHKSLRDLPFFLETPNELDGYQKEIEVLRGLYRD